MPDSGASGQDGGAQTVAKTRFDGLMSSHQKALAEVATLKAQLAGQVEQGAEAQDQDDGNADTGDSQQADFEDGGTYTYEGGKFVPTEPQTPLQHSEFRGAAGKREPSLAEMQAASDKREGKPGLSHSWPDITAS